MKQMCCQNHWNFSGPIGSLITMQATDGVFHTHYPAHYPRPGSVNPGHSVLTQLPGSFANQAFVNPAYFSGGTIGTYMYPLAIALEFHQLLALFKAQNHRMFD